MKIAIYGRSYAHSHLDETDLLFKALRQYNVELVVYAPYYEFVTQELGIALPGCRVYSKDQKLDKSIQYMLSVGGDGTFLDAAKLVLRKDIPILGINLGRLGFLAQVSPGDIEQALEHLFKGEYSVENRDVLQAKASFIGVHDFPLAINEISIQRNSPVMIKTIVKVNGDELSSYWSDGLLVATPTGSTAYSMSIGGPIMSPDSKGFIINPVAPHNLSIRPLIITDDSLVEIEIITRNGQATVSIDNTMFVVNSGEKLYIQKSHHSLKCIKLNGSSFFETLKNKLHWGFDPRN